jgi:hypothetical protein
VLCPSIPPPSHVFTGTDRNASFLIFIFSFPPSLVRLSPSFTCPHSKSHGLEERKKQREREREREKGRERERDRLHKPVERVRVLKEREREKKKREEKGGENQAETGGI